MKVLFLTMWDDHRDGGGAQVTLKHLTSSLARLGVEPVILSTSREPGLHQIEQDGIRIWRAGLKNIYWPTSVGDKPSAINRVIWHALDNYNIGMQSLLKEVISMERPNVASVHQINGWSPLAWKTLAESNIPSANILHANEAICVSGSMYKSGDNCPRQCRHCRAFRMPYRGLSNHVTAVVGVSQFILDRHLQEGYFKKTPIKRVINNARDPNALGVDFLGKRKQISGTPLRFGFIGRLEQAKGVENLLAAFSAAAIPNAELWIAGSGKTDYEQYLHGLGNSDNIRFLGHVPQCELFPNVDVMIVPSLWNDTFPGVVFESFAFGKPVIGSRRGGIPEMIHHGENGLLFEPDNPDELTQLLRKIADDETLRDRLSKAAAQSAKPFLDQDAWARKYIDLYEEIENMPTN